MGRLLTCGHWEHAQIMANENQPDQPSKEDLSFAALQAELGDAPAPAAPAPEEQAPEPLHEPASGMGAAEKPSPEDVADRINARVLTASGGQGNPAWVGGLVFSVLVCFGAYLLPRGANAFGQPLLSYIVMALSLGAAGYNGFALREAGQSSTNKALLTVALALALVAALAAFLARGAPPA